MASSSKHSASSIAADIGKAINSILKKYEEEEDDDDFVSELPPRKKTKILPSSFVKSKGKNKATPAVQSNNCRKVTTYHRDIICLPMSYRTNSCSIPIPRDRNDLSRSGLIGKITLTSEMQQDDIFNEIRSVFHKPMNDSSTFSFQVLQPIGGKGKGLTIPAKSSSYHWTACSIVPKNAKVPLYILANEPLLKIEVSDSEEEIVDLTSDNQSNASGKKCDITGTKSTGLAAGVTVQKGPSFINDSTLTYNSILGDTSDWSLSPTPPPTSPLTPTESSQSLFSSLLAHRVKYLPNDYEDRIRITVRRRHILEDTIHILRAGHDTTKHLKVTFVGEPAVDAGGPLREFFHLLLQELANNGSLFCGPSTSRTPKHNIIELDKGTFYYIGVIFSLSIIHGGPGPQFLSEAVADYIVRGFKFVRATVQDIPDHLIRESLQKLLDAENEKEFNDLLSSDVYDFRFDIGLATNIQYSKRHDLISSVAKHFAIHVVKSELDQMMCGISETLHALELFRENAVLFRPLFIYSSRMYSADDIYDMFSQNLSPNGSNRREREEAVVMFWINFLRDIQASNGTNPVTVRGENFKISLADIVSFATGMPFEPPMGFSPFPTLGFCDDSNYPTCHTCTNGLILPLGHVTYDAFLYHMCYGIAGTAGFGDI